MKQKAAYWREQLESLRSNKVFEIAVISIIVVSALLIGATTYDESNRFERLIYWLDWFVTVFFLIEIIIRQIGRASCRERV